MSDGLGKCYNCNKRIESNAWQWCPFCGKRIIRKYSLPKKSVEHRNKKGAGSVRFDKSKSKYRARLNGAHLGYFDFEADAWSAIEKEIFKSENPDKLDTVKDVFEKWISSKESDVSVSCIKGYKTAFSYFPQEVQNMFMIDVRTSDLDKAFQNAKKNNKEGQYSKIRIVANGICKYAIYHDLIEVNYAQALITPKRKKKKRDIERFSDEELEILWKHKTNDVCKTILIFCYTGFRPSELFLIKTSDVDIEKRIMVGGIKTEAGKNRRVPIANKILPFVKYFMSVNDDYLIQNHSGHASGPIDVNNWRKRYFTPTLIQYGILENEDDRHLTPKSGRKTFASLADNANIKNTTITRIVGHTEFSTTDDHYIKKQDKELIKAVDLL